MSEVVAVHRDDRHRFSKPAVDAITAVPQAMASRAGKPKPSKREGSISAMAPA